MAGESTATGAAVGTAISPGLGTVIGAGLGLVGDLFGSSSSSSEARKMRKEAKRQFDTQMNESVQRRVQDALKAGINPLTALGYNGGASPTIHAGGDSGSGQYLSRAGDRMQRMMEKLTEEKAQDDLEYDREAKALDLEGKRLENRILSGRIEEQQQNLRKGSAKEIPPVDAEPSPTRIGDKPIFSIAYDLQDRPRLVVNQDVLEGDTDNAGYVASVKHAISQGFINKVTGEVDSEQYRMMLDDMYYNMTGRHIQNLNHLYFSPAEVAALAAAMARGI